MTSNALLKSRKTQTDFRPSSIANFQESTTLNNAATVVEENGENGVGELMLFYK